MTVLVWASFLLGIHGASPKLLTGILPGFHGAQYSGLPELGARRYSVALACLVGLVTSVI